MKVESHKKKLASKILPLLNLFQSIPKNYLATTDRERKMHEDFKVLVRSIIIALQKYGYAEFSPGTIQFNFISVYRLNIFFSAL